MEAVKIRVNRFLIFFLISLLVFNSFTLIGLSFTEIVDETQIRYRNNENSFLISSNGSFYSTYFESFDDKYYTYASYDNGDTWVNVYVFSDPGTEPTQHGFSTCIDSRDYIHYVYISTFGSDYVYYRAYDTTTDTTFKSQIDLSDDTDQSSRYPFITVNYLNDVFVFWRNSTGVVYRIYEQQYDSWGPARYYDCAGTPIGLSADTNSVGDYYLSYINQSAAGMWLNLLYYDLSGSATTHYSIRKLTGNDSLLDYTDILIENDNIHITYVNNVSNGDLCINYTYRISAVLWLDEQIYYWNGYDQDTPRISYSIDGNLHIIWSGRNDQVSTDYIFGKTGTYGSWGSLIAYSTGSNDNNRNPNICYQNYPYFTKLLNGLAGHYLNYTDYDMEYFYSGTLIQYEGEANGSGEGSGTFYIYFFDRTTSDYFTSFNLPFGTSYLSGSLSSDMNNDNIYTTGTSFPLEITTYFNNGEYHYINLTNPTSYGMGVGYKAYYDFSTNIQIYHGQTYAFGLTPVGYSDPFYNTNCKWRTDWWIFQGWEACIATDKEYYTSGETVDLFYKMPTVAQLVDAGYDSTNWRVGIWNYQNVTDIGGLIFAYEDGLEFTSAALTFSDQWEADGNYDPPTPTSGTDIYIAAIYKPGGIFGNVDFIFWDLYLKFYVTEGSFTPSGNITAISPSEPEIGQNVNISFEANNNGRLTYKNLLDVGGENDITIFDKFTGTEYANRRFYEYGVYELNLYVSDGAFYTLVDTDYFYINTSNATGPGEYLTVRPYYAIAGFDTIFITYKTEVDGTLIDIVDALGQTTAYGTTVDTGGGTYTFDLPPGASIGTWYVTMYGNDTLTANFTVIADENNYFRFSKNQYYNDEHFAIVLNHDKRIAITFYKDGVPQGSDLIFAANQQAQGLYVVPFDIVTPSVGDWYAEMYEINNNIHIRLLAADNCTVIIKPTPDIEGGYDNILGMLVMAGDVFGGGALGLMVMSIFILIVVAVLLAKFKMDNSIILFISIIVAIALSVIGWLPWWITVLAIVLTGLLFGEAFSKKLNLGGK